MENPVPAAVERVVVVRLGPVDAQTPLCPDAVALSLPHILAQPLPRPSEAGTRPASWAVPSRAVPQPAQTMTRPGRRRAPTC